MIFELIIDTSTTILVKDATEATTRIESHSDCKTIGKSRQAWKTIMDYMY